MLLDAVFGGVLGYWFGVQATTPPGPGGGDGLPPATRYFFAGLGAALGAFVGYIVKDSR